MEQTLERIERSIGVLGVKIEHLGVSLDIFKTETNQRFEEMEKKFEKKIDESVEKLAIMTKLAFDEVDGRFDEMDHRFDKLEFRMSYQGNRIENLEDKVSVINHKIGL